MQLLSYLKCMAPVLVSVIGCKVMLIAISLLSPTSCSLCSQNLREEEVGWLQLLFLKVLDLPFLYCGSLSLEVTTEYKRSKRYPSETPGYRNSLPWPQPVTVTQPSLDKPALVTPSSIVTHVVWDCWFNSMRRMQTRKTDSTTNSLKASCIFWWQHSFLKGGYFLGLPKQKKGDHC